MVCLESWCHLLVSLGSSCKKICLPMAIGNCMQIFQLQSTLGVCVWQSSCSKNSNRVLKILKYLLWRTRCCLCIMIPLCIKCPFSVVFTTHVPLGGVGEGNRWNVLCSFFHSLLFPMGCYGYVLWLSRWCSVFPLYGEFIMCTHLIPPTSLSRHDPVSSLFWHPWLQSCSWVTLSRFLHH